MSVDLTANFLTAIENDQKPEDAVLQVLNFKRIASNQDPTKPERYRIQLSDGTSKSQSIMLATQLNPLIVDGVIKKNSVIMLKKYVVNNLNGKKIVVVLGLDVLVPDAGRVLGNPQAMDGSEGNEATAPTNNNSVAAPEIIKPKSEPFHPFAPQSTARSMPLPANVMTGPAATPIAALTPYNTRWTLQVRVTNKTAMRTWSKEKSEGKLFSVELLDDSGEIRATAFKEVADKYYPILEVGKVYRIKGGNIKPANMKFSGSIKNSFELSFNDSTEITPIDDAPSNIPTIKYSFTPLSKLETTEPNSNVDVIGVCTDISVLGSVTVKKDSSQLAKREVTLVDQSLATIRCTLWGKTAETFEQDGGVVGVVLVIKGARVSDYGGRSLSASGGGAFNINPNIPEATTLRSWYQNTGSAAPTKMLTGTGSSGGSGGDKRILISQIKEENLGMGAKADYFSIKGAITFVKKENCLYKACTSIVANPVNASNNAQSSNECNKKLNEVNGELICERCNNGSTSLFKWRLMLTCAVSDATGQQWLTCFQESAEAILGRSADSLGALLTENPAAFESYILEATHKTMIFKCRARADTFNDEQRVKVTCLGVTMIDYAKECDYLIAEIKKYL